MKPTHIYEFEDPRFVEMTSRCCRVWVSRDVLDEEVVQVAERVLRAGMSMLHQPFMAICWSSFLIDVRTSYQSGYVALQVSLASGTVLCLSNGFAGHGTQKRCSWSHNCAASQEDAQSDGAGALLHLHSRARAHTEGICCIKR